MINNERSGERSGAIKLKGMMMRNIIPVRIRKRHKTGQKLPATISLLLRRAFVPLLFSKIKVFYDFTSPSTSMNHPRHFEGSKNEAVKYIQGLDTEHLSVDGSGFIRNYPASPEAATGRE